MKVLHSKWLKGVKEIFEIILFNLLSPLCSVFCQTSALTDVSQSGGNVMVRGTAETAQTSPPPARLDTAGLASFSAMMETAPVRTSSVTATGTAMMAQMKTLCFVVGSHLLLSIFRS